MIFTMNNGTAGHKLGDHEFRETHRPRANDFNGGLNSFSLAADEWENVATVVPDSGFKRFSSNCKTTDLITFNEALQFFQTANLQEHSKQIRPVIERHGVSFFFNFICGSPTLCRSLLDERDLVFTIAACPLDNNEPIHMRVLQTIFKQMTGDRLDCPRYGRHWEQIGFQGTDPGTDLRGVGFWGLMNLLYMLMNPLTLPLARSIYKLSHHETQNFPFVVMSINVTAIVLQTLREECLNRTCNRRQQVVAVVNEYFVAVFLHLYLRWKNENKTISHSGFVLKDVELYAKKNPRLLMKHCENYLSDLAKDDQQTLTNRTSLSSLPCATELPPPAPPRISATSLLAASDFSILPDTRRAASTMTVPAAQSNGRARPSSFVAAISGDQENPSSNKYLYSQPPYSTEVVNFPHDLEAGTIIHEGEQELFI